MTERVATAAAELWVDRHDCDYERDILRCIMIDGECLLLDDGTVVPATEFEPALEGPDWAKRVVGYRIGKGAAVRREGLLYLGDRRQGEERADGWIFPSLPYIASLVNTRIPAGHALGALAKIASTIINTSPDRLVAGAGARTGIVHRETDNNAAGDQPITSTGSRERGLSEARRAVRARRRRAGTRRLRTMRASWKRRRGGAEFAPQRAEIRLPDGLILKLADGAFRRLGEYRRRRVCGIGASGANLARAAARLVRVREATEDAP